LIDKITFPGALTTSDTWLLKRSKWASLLFLWVPTSQMAAVLMTRRGVKEKRFPTTRGGSFSHQRAKNTRFTSPQCTRDKINEFLAYGVARDDISTCSTAGPLEQSSLVFSK
jgi:hypothetical protein